MAGQDGNAMRELSLEEMDQVSGGAGGQQCYCIDGYSAVRGEIIRVYTGTYSSAEKLCETMGIDPACIFETTV